MKARRTVELEVETKQHDLTRDKDILSKMQADQKVFEKNVKHDGLGNVINAVTIEGKTYDDFEALGAKLHQIADKTDTKGQPKEIGNAFGFPIKVCTEEVQKGGLPFLENRFSVHGNYIYRFNNGQMAMKDKDAAATHFLRALEKIPAIELNISCPNVKDGGMAFGVTCAGASSVVKAVRERYHKTLIVKLSPNVTDITEIARAVEAEGADSVSLINTLMGMAIDIEKRRKVLSIGTGGLSGPAVKPVALRMVYQVAKSVKIPVIGLGGICSAKDAIEFLMAGATAIEIGTANFLDPAISIKVRDGINDWLEAHGYRSVQEIIGVIE